MRRFDHIDLRVSGRSACRSFCAKVAPLLGFPYTEDGPEWTCFCAAPYPEGGEYLAITEDPLSKP